MNISFPIKVEIKAISSSGYNRDLVERRLADLEGKQADGDESVASEIVYLTALRKRKWGA